MGVLPPGNKLKFRFDGVATPSPPTTMLMMQQPLAGRFLFRELLVLHHCGQGEGAHGPQPAFEPNLSLLPGCGVRGRSRCEINKRPSQGLPGGASAPPDPPANSLHVLRCYDRLMLV